jgi:DnaJ-class molecular chaperone
MNIEIKLDKTCPTCHGTGKYSENYYDEEERGNKCEECWGNKFIPTEIGKEILDFISRHKNL